LKLSLFALIGLLLLLGSGPVVAGDPVPVVDFCGKKWPADSPEVDCDLTYRKGQPILRPADMDALLLFSSIQKFSLNGKIPESLAPRLKELKDVQVLHLKGAMLQNYIPMTHMRKLRELAFIGSAPRDFRPLRKVGTLRSLSIQWSGPRYSLKHLTKIRKLEHLSLYMKAFRPFDLGFLKRIKTLKSLELRGMFKNQKVISGLRRLRVLKVGHMPSRRVLKRLSKLEELSVRSSKVTDLKPVYVLKKLKILDLTGTKVTRLALHQYRKKFPSVDIRGCEGPPPLPCSQVRNRAR